MGKLSYEDKINLYNDKVNGLSMKSLSKEYNITINNVQYLCCLIEKHGFDILRTSKNKYYSKDFKKNAIDRVLIDNKSVWTVALDIRILGDRMLHN